jgi:hypothetical protein
MFPQALWLLREWRGSAPLLQAVADLYRMQLHRHGEALAYVNQRGINSPELIEEMRIGYAPGGCLQRALIARQSEWLEACCRRASIGVLPRRDLSNRVVQRSLERVNPRP